MPVRLKALLLCGDSRLGNKTDISTLSPAMLSCIYSMPPSYAAVPEIDMWRLLQNPAHGLLVPHVFIRWHACLYTQYLLPRVAEAAAEGCRSTTVQYYDSSGSGRVTVR